MARRPGAARRCLSTHVSVHVSGIFAAALLRAEGTALSKTRPGPSEWRAGDATTQGSFRAPVASHCCQQQGQSADLGIEYANHEMEISRVDLELATGHYHTGHLAERARADFQFTRVPKMR
jgi:hypothetical protein